MRQKAFAQIQSIVESKRDRFQEVISFVRQNSEVVEGFKHTWLSSLIQAASAKIKIRILYVDTINAAGGNNLERTGRSCEHLFKIVDRLDEREQISLQEFYHLFGAEIQNHHMIFEQLVENKKLVNFGKKKAALFLRHMHIIHTLGGQQSRFINDYNLGRAELVIPVDIVIVTILNKIWGTDLNANGHFDEINRIAKAELGEEFMLIEDLWFWGYFNTRVVGGRQQVSNEVNTDKYYSANLIYPNDRLREKLIEFSSLINRP